MNALLSHRAAKPLLFLLALGPMAWLLHGALTQGLGPNPAEALMRGTGDWVLRLLCLTLAVTPLRQWTGWTALARMRRMLGLYTFFYGLLHLLCYAWLDMGFDPAAIAHDIPKRPFMLVGTLALLLMLPLAATSFNRAIRALGALRWRRLHRLVYAVTALGLLHLLCYAWLDMGFDPSAIAHDIPKRPFMLVGTLALLLMLPLAATSFDRAIRALGALRWKRLHRLVHAVAALGLLHFFWMRSAKNDFAEVGVYAAVLALLLGWRLWAARRSRRAPAAARPASAGLTS